MLWKSLSCIWLVAGLGVQAQTCSQKIMGETFPTLLYADLQDLQYGLETGLFTSVDLVRAYLARIAEVNGTLSMVTEVNPDALAIAADLDDARASGNVTG